MSSARQFGVDRALGQYSIHVDPDDYVDSTMLADMLRVARTEASDVVVSDFYVEDRTHRETIWKQHFTGHTTLDLFSDIIHSRAHGSLCNKLIKHELYQRYSAHFIKGINYCEDVLIWAQLANEELKVSYLPAAFYHYCYTDNSITRNQQDIVYSKLKQYVNALASLPISQKHDYFVRLAAHRAKMKALYYRLLTEQEYYAFFPSKWDVINQFPFSYRIFGLIALTGQYQLAYKFFEAYGRFWQWLHQVRK